MKLVIVVQLGNETMQSAQDVLRALHRSNMAATDETPFALGETGRILDANGNRVGAWHIQSDE